MGKQRNATDRYLDEGVHVLESCNMLQVSLI